jgi:hypothetical protein
MSSSRFDDWTAHVKPHRSSLVKHNPPLMTGLHRTTKVTPNWLLNRFIRFRQVPKAPAAYAWVWRRESSLGAPLEVMCYNETKETSVRGTMSEPHHLPDFVPFALTAEENPDNLRRTKSVGRLIVSGAGWLADRVDDLGHWAGNLVRFLPWRLARVATTLAVGAIAVVTLGPTGWRVLRRGRPEDFRPWLRSRVRQGALRLVQLALEVLDVFGAPELFAWVWRVLTHCTPLTGAEIEAAAGILGSSALRYHDVRVAEGGLLQWLCRKNGNRAFATFHTVNLPRTGGHAREHLPVVIHELVHVYQYERAGSRYIAEALVAQRSEGYDYGREEGLARARTHGKRLRDFNREQQAQIVEDYFRSGVRSGGESVYDIYLAELRQGKI